MASSLHCYPNQEAQEIPFIAADLPQELLISILVRLPNGSLLRLRRVCRSWRALIASPLFISAHHDHQSAAGRCTLLVRHLELHGGFSSTDRYTLNSDDDSLTQIAQLDSPLASALAVPQILGSVKGLICLVNHTCLMFWNPAIRKSLILPLPTILSNSPHLGFGFDPSALDYKVVRIDYCNTGPCAQIYRLSTDSWSIIDLNPEPSNLPLPFSPQAYLNGVVHWIGSDSTIVGFDMRTENFTILKLPPDLPTGVTIAAWCGFLALFEFRHPNICLWVMKEYGMADSWIWHFEISGCGFVYPNRVKSIGSNGRILIEDSSRDLSWCDPTTQEFSEPAIRARGNPASLDMEPFTESLVLLDDPRAGSVASSSNVGRWGQKEEKLLARAWLNSSKDQRVKPLWSQIGTFFGKKRGLRNLQQRWYSMNKAVSKFHVCYSRLMQLHDGGLDESRILLKAHQVYKEEENANFRYEHVWRLLKDEPRWVDSLGSSSKSAEAASDGDAATRKGKAPQSAQSEEFPVLDLNAEMDLQTVYKDTLGMTEEQHVLHRQLLEEASKSPKADPESNV